MYILPLHGRQFRVLWACHLFGSQLSHCFTNASPYFWDLLWELKIKVLAEPSSLTLALGRYSIHVTFPFLNKMSFLSKRFWDELPPFQNQYPMATLAYMSTFNPFAFPPLVPSHYSVFPCMKKTNTTCLHNYSMKSQAIQVRCCSGGCGMIITLRYIVGARTPQWKNHGSLASDHPHWLPVQFWRQNLHTTF